MLAERGTENVKAEWPWEVLECWDRSPKLVSRWLPPGLLSLPSPWPPLLHHSAFSVPVCVSVPKSVSPRKDFGHCLLEMPSWGPALVPGQPRASGQSSGAASGQVAPLGQSEGYRAARFGLWRAACKAFLLESPAPGITWCLGMPVTLPVPLTEVLCF